ncbi:MAG: hypothetical protein FWF72_00095 [Paludibacter sp.]|nr:hypothetical protein [Paludibacter sp.]
MANKTQNITKLAVAVFMLLQFAVCFAENIPVDKMETPIVFIDENAMISGAENICTCLVDNNYSNATKDFTGKSLLKLIKPASNEKIKRENQSICAAKQKNVSYKAQLPVSFCLAGKNIIIANLPNGKQKRNRKLPSLNSNIFNVLSNSLKNNYLFKFYILKFTAINGNCINTVIYLSKQYGCLTAFAANSPPSFIK